MTQEETELVYEWIVATFGDPSEWTAASVLPKRGDGQQDHEDAGGNGALD